MKKKRLLYISETMVSGVLSVITGLANDLADDFDITIAYGLRPETPENLHQLFDLRVKLIPVPSFTRAISPKKDLQAFLALRQIAKQVQPDIIHLHSSKAGVLGRLAFPGTKRPVFYTPHGYSFLMTDSSPGKRALYRMIEAFCAGLGASTISCGPGEHRETLALTKKAYLVNNGIRLKELEGALSHTVRQEHPFTVFMLGRICTARNPEGFNAVAQMLPDIQFLWIGDGELRSQLTAPNIRITGWVSREEALSLAVNADAFLLPSLWEGLPISLLESMYLEKPCIVNNVIGSRDVIHNGVNGYVCSSTEEFAAAVRAVRAGEGAEMARRAHEEVLSDYNTEVQSRGYRKIYLDSLMKRKDATCL